MPLLPTRTALSLAVALACQTLAQAQTAAPAPSATPAAHAALPMMVVSGARQEQAVDDLPMSADIISEQALREQQSRTLRQALQDLPNVDVRSSPARLAVSAASSAFARDGNMGVNIRGLGGNRVLMTVDGIRMPRSYVSRSAMFDREYLSLELFKRIEIIRGPASALYGGDGMAGVLNFVTHDPQDFLQTPPDAAPKAIGGRVALGWSEEDHGWTETGTVAGRASEQLTWLLTASARQAREMQTMGTNHAQDINRTAADPLDARDRALLGKLVFKPDAMQRHTLTLEHSDKRQDVDQLSSRGSNASTGKKILDEYSSSKIERDRLAWDGRFGLRTDWADHMRAVVSYQQASSRRIGHSFYENTKTPTSPPITHSIRDNRYKERTWQIDLQADKVLRGDGWSHRLVYGLDHVRNDISNLYDGQAPLAPEVFPLKRFPDTRETSTAAYLQAESDLGNWTLTPGLRLEHYSIHVKNQNLYHPPAPEPARSKSGSAVLPKLGVLYRATDTWSVFGQYASGYRAPEAGQVNDRFQAEAPLPTGTIVDNYVIANPDLKPERSRGVELGLRGRMQQLSVDAVVFANRYSNLIEDARLIQSTPTKQVFQTVNVERARIHGFEFKGIYDWGSVADGRLRTSFSYGQTRGRDRSSGAPLNSVSPAQLSLGLRYDRPQWGVYADARHYWAKKDKDIDLVSIGNSKKGTTQFATPAATTLDLGAQWRFQKNMRLNVALNNVTDRKYWRWQDVYGVAAGSTALDAYTQPGRNLKLSLVADF